MKRKSPKPRARALASGGRGSSLLEVMLAIALIAVTSLGLIAGQLWTAREARAMSMREHAAWIADSVAEALYAGSADVALTQWSARANALLPEGKAVLAQNAGVTSALVTWTSMRNLPRVDGASEAANPRPSCGAVDAPAGSSCVALVLSQ